jgi:UDP-N-acetylmuramate dehydrogenase
VQIREHAPLAPLTTFRVGGPARFFAEPEGEAEVAEALAFARAEGLPTAVIGGGSNLLVADRGFSGLVLRPRLLGMVVEGAEVEVGAGEPWDGFVAWAVERGLAGVECLSGIPGDVGATPIQNVGAYGQEVAESILSVRALARATGEPRTFTAAECGFGYRDSVFKREEANRFVITRVRFRLRPGGGGSLAYAELAKKLGARPAPSLAEVRAAVIELRRSKSMVWDPADENHRSAGSFFMNPTVSADVADAAEARAVALGAVGPGEHMPRWPSAGGAVKLSAAWLIEHAGFQKGTGEGRVGLSTRHSLCVVNRGDATAAEIVAFARRVREGVKERLGVALTPEPVMLGFTAEERAALLG